MTMVGKNTLAGKQLLEIIEKLEVIAKAKKQLADDEKLIMAGAQASGFVGKFVKFCVKVRSTKPHDFQDHEALRDMYLHAIGMGETPPLFRQLEAMDDKVGKDAVIERFKSLVPRNGSFIYEVDGERPVRIWRDNEGNAHHETVEKAKPSPRQRDEIAETVTKTAPPPECTEAEAQVMGEMSFKENNPITANPFPFGDKRRGKWDRGWRHGSGTDGMGEDD